MQGFGDGRQYRSAGEGEQGPGKEDLVVIFYLGGMVDANRRARYRIAGATASSQTVLYPSVEKGG